MKHPVIGHVVIVGALATANVLLWPPSTARAQEPDPAELVASFEHALGTFQRSHFRADVKQYQLGGELPPGVPFNESRFSVWRDGNRWKQLRSSTTRRLELGKIIVEKDAGER